ncbi:hypothetical protein F4680DRAFT_466906 [Xylaria scruposa]|nr:hypothetical protein F4680DRAFT_466906 [Xylaria scruposa]
MEKPDLPLSPWAARFGRIVPSRDAVFSRGGVQHSGEAPELSKFDPSFPIVVYWQITSSIQECRAIEKKVAPWLDPIFYSDKPRTENAGTFENFNDIDRFYFSNMLQQTAGPYSGLRPWQIGVVHKTLKFSDSVVMPGGHQEAAPSAFKGDPETHPGWETKRMYDDGLIKPNEESWFSFLRKDRWLDWSKDAAVLNGEPWSVDNPQVWEVLSISLELANRVLRALAYDLHPFLIDLLYGYLFPWTKAAPMLSPDLNPPPPHQLALVIVTYGYYSQYQDTCEKSLSDYMEQLPRLGERNLIEKLEELLAKQTWSFHNKEGGYGITWAHLGCVITLHVDILTTLIEGNITLAERSLLQFKLAVVILHEMGWYFWIITLALVDRMCNPHAMLSASTTRSFNLDRLVIMTNARLFSTQIFDFGGASEIGHELDMAVWGCVFEPGLMNGINRPPFGLMSLNWPIADVAQNYRRGFFDDQHPELAPGKIVERELIPLEFTSKLLSESFWNDPGSPRKKSGNYFHRTRLFNSKTPYTPGNTQLNRMAIDQSLDLEQLTGTEKLMVQDWNEREALWYTVREGWSQETYDLWAQTPWKLTNYRWMIADFAAIHKVNIERATSLAETMTNAVPWFDHTTKEEYISYLEAPNHQWIIHILGLFMMASIPIRSEGQLSPTYMDTYGPEQCVPSKEAEKSGRSAIEVKLEYLKGGNPLPASRFTNPMNPGEATGLEGTHSHYLYMAAQVLWYLARTQRAVPSPWIGEILRVGDILGPELKARQGAAWFPGDVKDAWSHSWYFVIPEYNPYEMSMWNGDEWAPVQ